MILVTGATGNVGRLVVDELVALGADVRALTVDPERAALPAGVQVARGYLGRPETVRQALAGVDRMYLAPLPDTVTEITALACAAGVRHIVDLAGGKGSLWYPIEEAVEASGVAWTHLEAGEFMLNTGIWAPQIRAGDEIRDGHPTAANAPIAIEDIAAVAARILVDPAGHVGRAYELTGPTTLTRAEMIRLIGIALDRPLRCVGVPRDEAVALLAPEMGDYAAWYVDGIAQLVEHPQRPLDTVARLLGRPATTFAEWAVNHAALFR
jgi:uncharacterized protein YbjT (DUF2867 family)